MADKEDMIAIHFICKFDKDKTISYINLFNLTRRQPIRLSFEVIVFKGTDSPSILPMRSRFSDFSQSGISTSSMSVRSSTSLLGSSWSSWRIRAFRLSRRQLKLLLPGWLPSQNIFERGHTETTKPQTSWYLFKWSKQIISMVIKANRREPYLIAVVTKLTADVSNPTNHRR